MTSEMIGRRLISLRESRGYKQCEVADTIGCCRQSMTSWEQGKVFPPIPFIVKLADLYGCSVDFLLCRTTQEDEFNRNSESYKAWEWSIRQDERYKAEKQFVKRLQGVIKKYER